MRAPDGVEAAWTGDPPRPRRDDLELKAGGAAIQVPESGLAAESSVAVAPGGARVAFATAVDPCAKDTAPSLYVADAQDRRAQAPADREEPVRDALARRERRSPTRTATARSACGTRPPAARRCGSTSTAGLALDVLSLDECAAVQAGAAGRPSRRLRLGRDDRCLPRKAADRRDRCRSSMIGSACGSTW